MVKIEEEEEDAAAPQLQAQAQAQVPPNRCIMNSSSSLSPHNHRPQQPSPPDTPSSISSDHTFHGFSPLKDNAYSPPPPSTTHAHAPDPPQALVPVPLVPSRLVRDQPGLVTKTETDAQTQTGLRPRVRQPSGVLRRTRREKLVKRSALGLRLCQFAVCLVSFSVMAADRNRGWALDSFDRYIELRYSLSINVIGFAYAALQGFDLLLQLTTGKEASRSQIRYCFDFAMDQILAYLLLSASSSAFTRVDDWISNWGQDKFPAMASASVGVSFLAFIAFALSSLISGYVLCTHRVI